MDVAHGCHASDVLDKMAFDLLGRRVVRRTFEQDMYRLAEQAQALRRISRETTLTVIRIDRRQPV